MGKDMTPKSIAKMIKAKGLQRLRWYCQFCQKQCRDENGFKCHQSTDGHLKQMEIVASNASMFVENFSKEFEADFLKLMSRRYPTGRVSANQVYNDYIKDRNHIHMNSTTWSSLSEFVKYLGRESKAVVEDTPKGWFITYVDRDPEAIARKERASRKEKLEISEEERQRIDIEKRLKQLNSIAAATEDLTKEVKPTELMPTDTKVVLQMKPLETKLSSPIVLQTTPVFQTQTTTTTTSSSSNDVNNSKKKMSALDEIMEQSKAEKKSREVVEKHVTDKVESWIAKSIVVKIMEKSIGGGKFYKQKAVIEDLDSEYVAKVKTLEDNTALKIDQSFLETVIPAISNPVMILRGKYRGKIATLLEINIDKFCGTVQLKQQQLQITITDIPYEDFCKYNQ